MRRLLMPVAALILGAALNACSSPTTPSSEGWTTAHGASTPLPKAEVVGGVPLIPATPAQRAMCVKFADRRQRQVPCPGLVPKPIPVSPTSSDASCLTVSGEGACGLAKIQVTPIFLLSQSNFEVPAGYVGVSFEQYSGAVVPEQSVSGGPLGHFVFSAGGPPVPSYCSPLKAAKTFRVRAAVANFYQCSDSSSGPGQLQLILGHDLLVWKDAGVTTEVSFHGHSQVNLDLDVAVADATDLVSPSKR